MRRFVLRTVLVICTMTCSVFSAPDCGACSVEYCDGVSRGASCCTLEDGSFQITVPPDAHEQCSSRCP